MKLVFAYLSIVSCVLVATPAVGGESFTASDEFCEAIKQKPQEHLTRRYYRTHCGSRSECRKRHTAAIRYRTEHYGYFPGFGESDWNEHPPRHYAERTRFMGLPIRINKRVIPALKCVERELNKACTTCTASEEYPNECKKRFPYEPGRLSGIRFKNSFRGGEISNHVFGIAVDVDPSENTCCKCVARWRSHPLCKKRDLKVHERMIMPVCWVEVFEKYGFYWLGHDRLEDTMHFEFLGQPEFIEKVISGSQ
jgi:hypothetical protein